MVTMAFPGGLAGNLIFFDPHRIRKWWLEDPNLTLIYMIISIRTAYASGDHAACRGGSERGYFDPHRIRKRWPVVATIEVPSGDISIHTAYASGDSNNENLVVYYNTFRSTPHTQAVTRIIDLLNMNTEISIHTAYASGDWVVSKASPILFISIHTAYASGDGGA